ncbi:DUF6075 family protein [Ruminococcus sp.]
MYTDSITWTEAPEQLALVEPFCCEYAPYYWQALRIRFPQHVYVVS